MKVKTQIINFRCAGTTKLMANRVAASKGLSLSDYLCQLIEKDYEFALTFGNSLIASQAPEHG